MNEEGLAGPKPRLLVLSPRYPYPVMSGDRVRIVQLCKELSRHFKITLLCLSDIQGEFTADVPADAPFDRVVRLWLPRWRANLNVLFALLGRLPLQVAYYDMAHFRARAQELAQSHDIVLAHLIRTAGYAFDFEGPKVLEMTDAISLTYERTRNRTSRLRLRTWLYELEQRRVRQYEQAMLHKFDLVTLVSEVDREYLLEGTSAPHVIVCSNGVDATLFDRAIQFDSAPDVVFIGNLTTLQNLDACHHFASDLLPALRRVRPWRFRVIGRIRPADARALAELDGVEVVGEVDEIMPVIRGARAGVCPMRVGSGIQNKVLEYLALGLPTITSSLSMQALRAAPGRDLIVADTAEEYVSSLERLLADDEYSKQLAEAGRGYVRAQHDWSTRLRPMVRRMLDLVRAR